jgi:hypothetical protein
MFFIDCSILAELTVPVHGSPDFAVRPSFHPNSSPRNEAVEPHTIAIITRFCSGVVI